MFLLVLRREKCVNGSKDRKHIQLNLLELSKKETLDYRMWVSKKPDSKGLLKRVPGGKQREPQSTGIL
jgi:hypothetical protein